MGRLKRYRTAWSRHHRSRGFGIHSPFAFKFVRGVLGERLPYYSYDHLSTLRKHVVKVAGGRWCRSRVISFKDTKKLFRIVNFFNPQSILQVGTSHGVTSASMMAVSNTSHLFLYEPLLDKHDVARQIIELHGDRVSTFTAMEECVMTYRASINDNETPFVLVNHLENESDGFILEEYLTQIVEGSAVMVLRNIDRNKHVKHLWLAIKNAMPHGQTYTNEKTAIIVALPKLQREDFFLWL